jgi:hypothetical protein
MEFCLTNTKIVDAKLVRKKYNGILPRFIKKKRQIK